ncbi:acetoacetate decarboxylase [Rhodoligotrophos appendicifer]|uniref:acetoacetate decarboxylase family protein n=1 Tax=Rhodoligotrophos appendicifer TaxID=987056 RepID=UPI0011852A18|nr:acetoacetate decarboxylase family protein [Rhodoligotrophos appendicifer]
MSSTESPFIGPNPITFCVPDRSPLYKPLPRLYRNLRKLSVYARGDMAGIRKLVPPEFEPASDIVEFFVMHCPIVHDEADPTMGPRCYSEGGVVVSVSYKGKVGGHVAYEFVTTDDAMCGGREIMGYPKKFAEVELTESGKTMQGTVRRLGRDLIIASFEEADAAVEKPVVQPRYQVKRIPRADGMGYDVNQVVTIQVGNSKLLERRTGKATLSVGGHPNMDPLSELGIKDVVGAEFIVGEFDLGYGEILEDLLKR